jgi:CBS-domain-containing membrane protein
MTTDVIVASPNTSFHALVQLMLTHRVSGIPIVDEERRPVGIVSESDMISKEAYQSLRHLPADDQLGQAENVWAAKSRGRCAADLMSTPVRTVRPDDLVRLAAARMVTTGINRLPVTDAAGRLVGLVSRSDVLGIYHRTDVEVLAAVEHTLDDPLLVPDNDMTASVADGIVTLAGHADAPAHVRLAISALGEVAGVVDIVDRVDVGLGQVQEERCTPS